MEKPGLLPRFDYYLDESDPDVVILRRQDGAFVAAFSSRGITKEGILEAAKEDYRALLEAYERCRSGEPLVSRRPSRSKTLRDALSNF